MLGSCDNLEFIEKVELNKFINSQTNKVVDTGKYRLSYAMYRLSHLLKNPNGSSNVANIFKLNNHEGINYDNAPLDNVNNIELGDRKFILHEIVDKTSNKSVSGFIFKDGKDTLMLTTSIH